MYLHWVASTHEPSKLFLKDYISSKVDASITCSCITTDSKNLLGCDTIKQENLLCDSCHINTFRAVTLYYGQKKIISRWCQEWGWYWNCYAFFLCVDPAILQVSDLNKYNILKFKICDSQLPKLYLTLLSLSTNSIFWLTIYITISLFVC